MSTVIHCYGPAGYRTSTDIASLPALLGEGARLWIDTDEGDARMTEVLTNTLGLHPLAVEDILQDRPAPKIEDYGEYLYVVAHGVHRDHDDTENLCTIEIDMVLTKQWVLTHRTRPMRSTEAVESELARNPRLLDRGPAFIAHAILDHLVDHYTPLIDAFEEDISAVELEVIDNPQTPVLERIFRMKRSLQRLRRVAVYQRELLLRLSRGQFDVIPEKALPFYRDVYDHFARVSDLTDSYREQLTGALDAYLSVVSNRMNEVMKALTLVATIMLPLTFIAGIYGMNFEHMPELKWRYGYAFALGLMAAVAVGMVGWFRHKGWLWARRATDRVDGTRRHV